MAARKDIYKDAKGFDKNPQNINRKGRPKRLVGVINDELKAGGYEPVSLSNINDAAMQILNLPLKEVTRIAQKESDYPLLYKLICKELLGKGAQNMLEKLMDRSFGKAQQKLKHSGEIKQTQTTDLSGLSDKTLKQVEKELKKNADNS